MYPRIGSMLFINRGDTEAAIRNWVAQMAASKLELIRLFVFWDQVEPREGEWDWSRFDTVFDEAARHGMKVVPTLFAQTPPGWMRKVSGCQSVGDLDDAAYRERALDYIRWLVTRWCEHPALDSYIPWNEASMEVPQTAATLVQYREFLRRKYGTIERLNAAYYPQFASFDEVGLCDEPGVVGVIIPDRISLIDWNEFAVEYLVGKLAAITGEIRRLDPEHPIHVNPHQMLKTMFSSSQSIWREADLMDFMGNSSHPASHMVRWESERFPQALSMINSLTRSATRHPQKHFWVSELQGGPALFSGNQYFTPQPEDLRAWLWESLGSGAKAIVFWCFNTRDNGGEGGEWGLLNQLGKPSRRLLAVTRVIEEVLEHRELLASARPPKTRIKILYSEASHLLSNVEASGGMEVQNPRNRERSADAMCGAFSMLDDLGFESGFIDERLLRAGGDWLAETDLLIVPGCITLEAGSKDALLRFARDGGTVIADGLCGWKTPDAEIDRAGFTGEFFGAAVEDIESIRGPFSFSVGGQRRQAAWFSRVSLLPVSDETEVLGKWDHGAAALTRHRCGDGAAVRIGTEFFQRYHAEHDLADLELLRGLIPFQPILRLQKPDPRVRLRQLDIDGGALFVAISTGPELETTLVAGAPGYLSKPGGVPEELAAETSLHLRPGEVQCFIYQTENNLQP